MTKGYKKGRKIWFQRFRRSGLEACTRRILGTLACQRRLLQGTAFIRRRR